ncbi:IPExxxVDY family protein [Capnocytophaga sp. ARDL2]|uniref:IPExxxVDY family protein n=1 Tax=Capnocytophaga sp. ARDL2 TaxID=3238809 RepID=UPI00355900F7
MYKLVLDDFYYDDFVLIAMTTSLEDYKLAYLINQVIQVHLCRERDDVKIINKTGTFPFSHYVFKDDQSCIWRLITNKSFVTNEKSGETFDLFGEIQSVCYFSFDYKTVDFWLKIENVDDSFQVDQLLKKLNFIKHISMAYQVEMEDVKNINNFIL